jgi:hypothetical protein
MQREIKKTKLPVNSKVKTAKIDSAINSTQEKLPSNKKIPVLIAEKITQNLKTKGSAKNSILAPQSKKPAAVSQTAKRPKKQIDTAVATKKSTPKAKQVKPEIATKKTKIVEKKVEIVITPIKQKPIKKKIKPIGSAIVRGKSGKYSFEVFSLDAELKDGSAIYVISKRVTDKSGKGHHKFVCIGQTESLLGDLKKHKKDKCIKQYKANVICLLREEDENNRLKIETDLRQAHTIVCNQK